MVTNIPQKQQPNKKGVPPKQVEAEVRNNLAKVEPTKMVALNFRVTAEFKRDFKIAAAMDGITQLSLLQKMFESWKMG